MAAVKVVVNGLVDFEPFDCVCDKCGSTLEVSESKDIKIGVFGSGMDDTPGDTELYVKCPACKNEISLKKELQKKYLEKLIALRRWKRRR